MLTIKSPYVQGVDKEITMFQFLMVRLKASQLRAQLNVMMFQFLMVRLKDKVELRALDEDFSFNSLWYD